jgi:hypothetical protein
MRTLGKIAAALGVVSAIGVTGVIPASADWYGRHYHGYYNYGGGSNPCGRGWSLQGGRCKPYHFGPWDVYGGRHQDWGYR